MLISRQQGIKRIAEILTASGLFTPDEIRMVFDYFEWNSDEALKLGHRDLDGVKKELLAEQLWFVRNEMAPMAVRAGNLYFALGVVDADNCLPDVCWVNKAAASTPVKMVSTFVYNMSMEYAERIREPHLRMLMNIARNDPEIIKEAYESRKDVKKDEPDNIILLTVYFLLKYPQVSPQDQTEDFAEFLKRQKCSKKETEQEHALMRQYEELLIQNFSKIYGTFADEKKPSRQALDEIERALREGKVDDRIRKLALTDTSNKRRSTYLDELWKYTIGLAFINFSLSARLKDVASVCIAANADEMLFVINRIDMRGDFRDRGGNFDKIFCIDAPTLINCAVAVCNENILKEQFGRNREIYLNCMETKNLESYFFMSQVTGQVDAAFHKEREQPELARQQKRLMDVFTSAMDVPKREEMKKYLSGETDVKALYLLAEKIRPGADLVWPWNCMGHYRKGYGYDNLCKRCEAAMMVCGGFDLYCRDYLFDCNYMYEEVVVDKDRMKELFRAMEEEQLTLSSRLSGFLQISDAVQYEKKVLKAFTDVGKEIFGVYLEMQTDGMLEAFRRAEVPGRIFGLQVLAGNKKLPADIICSFASDKSKEVREALVDILSKSKVYERNVREMLASQKVVEREVAVKVLVKWAGNKSGEKYVPVLKEVLEKETSAKIRTLLAGVIPVDVQEPAKEDRKTAKESKKAAVKDKKTLQDIDIVKELHKGNKKRFLAWAYETPFPKVHNKTGEEAEEEYLQAILLAYAAMSLKDVMVSEDDMEAGKKALESGGPLFVNSIAASLAQALNEEEFATYAGELLERWIAGGSDTRKRWVLYAAALHGNAETTERICQKLPEWAADSKTVAVEAIQALVFGLTPRGLLFVDGIARKKYKVKGTRDAAEKTLKAVAARLGTTREGLLDRTVPDFGFDDQMRRLFDYGKRKFFVTINAAFETEVFDETGKKLKKLPAPGKQDDEKKAAAAYEEFKQLKKQIKEAASSQKMLKCVPERYFSEIVMQLDSAMEDN